jgi:hypothetical protein
MTEALGDVDACDGDVPVARLALQDVLLLPLALCGVNVTAASVARLVFGSSMMTSTW